jgi:hypothetical protein
MSEDTEKVKLEGGEIEIEQQRKLLPEDAAKSLNQSVDPNKLEVC